MGAQFLYARGHILNNVIVNATSTGDNVAINAPAGASIVVHSMVLTTSAATNITFKDNGGALSGVFSMSAYGSIVLDIRGEPWYVCDFEEQFIINQSGTAAIRGNIYYALVPNP